MRRNHYERIIMNPDTIVKTARIANGVAAAAMFGVIFYSAKKAAELDRDIAEGQHRIAYGNFLMKNWHRMPFVK
jgi:hypothetical protein